MAETKTGSGLAARPMSPHLQVWRWHITMAGSILHRATGIALYGGAVLLALWAASLAGGQGSFELYKGLLGSWLGKIVLFGLTFSIFYHMANGVRHLVWDVGKGFEPRTADMTGVAAIVFAAVVTVAIWVLAAFTGVAA
jgi:succinate dehydrogenase / fumarate reductase cytochrome b subunit